MATWCLTRSLIQRMKHWHRKNALSGVHETFCHQFLRLRGPSGLMIHPFHSSSYLLYKQMKRTPLKTKKKSVPMVTVYNDMTLKELAEALGKNIAHVYDTLEFISYSKRHYGKNEALDLKLIHDIVKKSGMRSKVGSRKTNDIVDTNKDIVKQPPPQQKDLTPRPPVVTIMGHVDHGKTTLLDQLRNSNIVDKEFGGITQHIGAFLVKLQSGDSICFLDTPGHAAFSAMRSRGANLTDIVVLVVAADDGVMQQTQESIQHAKQSGVPIIVAINKIDKSNADVERSKMMLMEQEVMLEEQGGEIQAVPISALKGTNLLELQEAIVTQAELMNIQGDANGLVEGRVVEARHCLQRGRMVTAVIQRGTLKKGDILVAGTAFCKVRVMYDEFGKQLQKVGPGHPVDIWGFKETPSAGEEILQAKSESEAKTAISWRKSEALRAKQESDEVAIRETRDAHTKEYRADLSQRREAGIHRKNFKVKKEKEIIEDTHPHLGIVLKGDVDGSVEAILGTLGTYNDPKCRLDIIRYGVGGVTESDVEVAAAFGGEVIAFNVDVPTKVAAMAKDQGVPIRPYNIIYRLFDDLKEGLSARLPMLSEHSQLGEAKVLQVFYVTLPNKKKSNVAGCRCIDGNIGKKYAVKVIRNEETVYEGKISMLKNFKVEVENIKAGQECGICLEDHDFKFKTQDIIISYELKDVVDRVVWNLGF